MKIKEYFSYFSLEPYVVTPHLKRLDETVQVRDHNICFNAELTKQFSIIKYPFYLELWSSIL